MGTPEELLMDEDLFLVQHLMDLLRLVVFLAFKYKEIHLGDVKRMVDGVDDCLVALVYTCVLYSTAHYRIVLYNNVLPLLYCTVLYCNVLYCTVLYCNVL